MDPEITIRRMEWEDIESFHACLDAVARERDYLGRVKAPPIERTREWLARSGERGDIRLVAENGAEIVGWCDIGRSEIEGFRHSGRLGMGVLEDYRGQGIGSALMDSIIRAAREQDLERIELDVFASNIPAIRLYEKYGFEVEGRKRRARKLDGRYDDLILMALFL